jgi:hypothetical protein
MNTTGLDLHLRGRQIIECEAFERTGKNDLGKWANTLTIIYKGYLSPNSSDEVAVVVTPSANKNKHRFPRIDVVGDGYAYEGSHDAPRGWRLKLSQLALQ